MLWILVTVCCCLATPTDLPDDSCDSLVVPEVGVWKSRPLDDEMLLIQIQSRALPGTSRGSWLHSLSSSAANSQDGLAELQVMKSSSSTTRPRVDIYYETRCPFSLEFINTTLREAWEDQELWKHMDVKLHPFGNAHMIGEKMISEGFHFWHPHEDYPIIICQHDDMECLGNRLQACAIDLLEDSGKYVPFVICMSSYGLSAGLELTSFECGKKHGVDMDKIKACTDSKKGQDLVLTAGRTTVTANVSHVPWLTVNGNHTTNDTLLAPVCDLLSESKPKACKKDGEHLVEAGKKGGCGGSGGSLLARGSVTSQQDPKAPPASNAIE